MPVVEYNKICYQIQAEAKQIVITILMKPIQPLQLKCQNVGDDKQNTFTYAYSRELHSYDSKTMLGKNHNKSIMENRGLGVFKENQMSKRTKTSQNVNQSKPECQFLKTFYNTSEEFIKVHKPFLENKRIIFNVKNRNRSNFITNRNTCQINCEDVLKENNIEKLKKQIIQLDKEDFVSYRSKIYSNPDEIKVIENEKINKYNYQNSMIVEWKGKLYQKPFVVRPSSTIGISVESVTPTNKGFIGLTSHSSVARKYFSKPKHRKNLSNSSSNTTEIYGSNILNNSKMKLKTEEIAIGLNMFRGKVHRKKINSSFQIHC